MSSFSGLSAILTVSLVALLTVQMLKDKFEMDEIFFDKNSYNKISDITLKISGCPNTCGHHSIAHIGFYGAAKRCFGRIAPFYQLVINGHVEEGRTRLAERIGLISARRIPDFLFDFLISRILYALSNS